MRWLNKNENIVDFINRKKIKIEENLDKKFEFHLWMRTIWNAIFDFMILIIFYGKGTKFNWASLFSDDEIIKEKKEQPDSVRWNFEQL